MIELYEIERKMIYAKYNRQKLKYLWYKRKYNKMRKRIKNG